MWIFQECYAHKRALHSSCLLTFCVCVVTGSGYSGSGRTGSGVNYITYTTYITPQTVRSMVPMFKLRGGQ